MRDEDYSERVLTGIEIVSDIPEPPETSALYRRAWGRALAGHLPGGGVFAHGAICVFQEDSKSSEFLYDGIKDEWAFVEV